MPKHREKRCKVLQAQLDEAHALIRTLRGALAAMSSAQSSRNELRLLPDREPGNTFSAPPQHLLAAYWIEKIDAFPGMSRS